MSNVNPCGCSAVDTECCENRIADALKATFTNQFGCAALNGIEVTLVWNGFEWKGATTCGTQTIALSLRCLGTPEPDCSFFELDADAGCGIELFGIVPDSCNCDPLNLVFTIDGVTADCDCCEEWASVELTLTITE